MLNFKRMIAPATAGLVASGALVLTVTTTASTAEQLVSVNAPMTQKASFIPPARTVIPPALNDMAREMSPANDNKLVFSAPPRETAEEGKRIYQPIAEYLSRITGRTIVYKHASDWLIYQTEMQRGSFDLVFDDSHLNSWRISHLRHSALVKIAEEQAFMVVVRRDNARITDIKQLAGQKICGMTPPNLGTLAVLSQFDNPMRQPLIINTLGWSKAYDGVVSEKKCTAAIIPMAHLMKFSNSENLVRVVYMTKALPNQTLSAGPRVSTPDQAKIAAALMTQDGAAVTAKLVSISGSDRGLTYASQEDYAGLDVYLKDSWGYTR